MAKNKTILKQPDLIQESRWEGLHCRFELFLATDFSHLSNVTQAYGIILDDKHRVLLVSGKGAVWILPGGGVEKGESYQETVIREVYEESAVVITRKTIEPFFYQRACIKENGKWKFTGNQVRYTALIKKRDKFKADPDLGDMNFQKFVSIENLPKYLKWGKTTKFVQKHLEKQIKNFY